MGEGEGEVYGGVAAEAVSLACCVVAVGVSAWHIAMHLRNYTEPTYQRYIVRIIFMVPVYAMMSFGALACGQYAMYFNTIRDVYEAWVIYNFLSLCLAWVGGPGAVVTSLSGRLLKPSCLLMTCFMPPIPLDGRFIRRCKQGCLQFVFLKPLLAALCLVLYSRGLYSDGNFSLGDSYIYITCVYMASYTVAIYALILFYVACKDLLYSFNPIPKFLMIKAVVFLTYWQGVLIFTVGEVGWVRGGAADAADLQNVLICVEMALGALGFLHAFPYKPFMAANIGAHTPGIAHDGAAEHTVLSTSIKHAIDLHDVVSDTVHQFAPSYHDYVLYSDGSQDGPTHYRTRTFVPVGRETCLLHSTSSRSSAPPEFNSMLSAPDPLDADALSSRASSLLSARDLSGRAEDGTPGAEDGAPGPVTTPAAHQSTRGQQGDRAPGERQLAQAPGGGGSTSSVVVGGASITVRLPPPPESSRNRASSAGFEGANGEARASTAADSSVPSSQRSSATDASGLESLALKRSARGQIVGSHTHHLDLLMDEEELTRDDPSKDDLEGFIQR